MRKAAPVALLLALIAIFMYLRNIVLEPNADQDKLSGQVLPSTPPEPPKLARTSQEVREAKAQPQKVARLQKAPARPKTQDRSSEEILAEASKSVLAQSKVSKAAVEQAKKSDNAKEDSVPRVSRYRMTGMQQAAEPIVNKCDTEACQKSQDGYTVVGLVVSTSPSRINHNNLRFNGDFAVGDAKRQPLLYLK